MKSIKYFVLIVLMTGFLFSCVQEKEGSFEKAGKKIDQKVEKVQDSAKELKEEIEDEIDDHTKDGNG